MDPLLIDIRETCHVLGIGRTKVYQLIGCGDLETVKLGKRTLIRFASVRRLAGEPGAVDMLTD